MINLLFFAKVESQISYTVNINTSDLSINNIIAKDGNTYSKINVEKLYSLNDTSKPSLPVKYIKLYIPDGKDVHNISITTSSAISYNLTSKVFPVQKPIPISINSTVLGFINPDSIAYNSNTAWPVEMVKMIQNEYFDIKNRIITIAVTPFQYYPLMNKLDFYSSINITVNLKSSSTSPVNSVLNRSPHIQAMYADILKGMVDNPQDIVFLNTPLSSPNTSTNTQTKIVSCGLSSYEYVIITDANLVSGFTDFIDWKKKKGINIGIVTTNDIYACHDYKFGDLMGNYPINDNAGKVRQYLYDAHFNGNPSTTWALIAGDYNTNVPIRIGDGSDNSTDS